MAVLLAEVADGRHPPADGRVTVMRPPGDVQGVLAFTSHHVVVADVGPDWVRRRLRPGDLSAPLSPPFLGALAEATGRTVTSVDAVMVGPPADPADASDLDLTEIAPGVSAEKYRTGVRAWACVGGAVELGRGLAGRWEVTVEVEDEARGRGLGRTLFAAARHLVAGIGGPEVPVWAQVSPGNVASVRALLEAGYRPGGAEALLL
ncbi:MAG TPA: N-acetyltransferase [Pseudonocardiaceae bacterium]